MSLYLPLWRQALADQESALMRCDTQAELEDAWFAHCDGLADGSRARRYLQRVYAKRLAVVQAREAQRDEMLRLARAS